MDTIYLLKDQLGYYKIGFTKNTTAKRIKQLQTGNSGEIEFINEFKTNHKRKVETSLHNLYKHLHINGEFYELGESEVSNFSKTCSNIEKGLDALKLHENKFY